jgi:D-beta-D-heptose 7-phosphate kinase/D-beta-D-heptose 1-phosphate adenosyltransferase
MTVVAISGGFDPVHRGHVSHIREAKKLGDKLVVILNNDNWLMKKKGYVFMPQEERKIILEALRGVDEVVITGHSENPDDMSICKELESVRPDIFANGGDRHAGNIPEYDLCEKLRIKMKFSVGGGKEQSSSSLVEKIRKISN